MSLSPPDKTALYWLNNKAAKLFKGKLTQAYSAEGDDIFLELLSDSVSPPPSEIKD